MPNVAQRLESELLKYPGMLADETLVWRTWAALHQSEYDRFDHNIRMGPDQDPGPAFLPQVRRGAILNAKLRLDSVAWHGVDNSLLPAEIESPAQVYEVFPSATCEIIEVKRRATNSALGEIAAYFHTWVAEFPNNPQPDLRIVCAEYAKTLLTPARSMGIILDPVNVSFSILSNAHGS